MERGIWLISGLVLGIVIAVVVLDLPVPVSSRAPSADTSCRHGADSFRCVRYLRNYDADTITVFIPDVPDLLGKEISVRVKGVDTPERRTRDACEKKRAKEAKEAVARFLRRAESLRLTGCERDKYFRLLCDVEADGRSLSRWLLAEGLAYAYDGGTKPDVDWCRGLARKKGPRSAPSSR